MQELINGSQFQRLLDKDSAKLRRKYDLKKVDFNIIKYISKNASYDRMKALVDLELFSEEELAGSLKRLYSQNLIDVVADKNTSEPRELKLTGSGENLWKQIQDNHKRATEVLFKGMTDEQVKTFQRLSHMILNNIEAELKKE